jgi:hypothetical protein
MNPWRILPLVAAVCLFAGYGAVSLVQKQAAREVDRHFLDDMVRQQGQDADTHFAPGRNIATASTIGAGHPLAPRAELVINSAIVRRAELVVHDQTVNRKRQRITTSPQNSQVAAEFPRQLN